MAAESRAEDDGLSGGELSEHGILLGHVADNRTERVPILVNVPSLVLSLDDDATQLRPAQDSAHQGGFPATAQSCQGDERATWHVETDVTQPA